MLDAIGAKLAKILGDHHSDYHHPSYVDDAYQKMAGFYKICDLLPYESFDEESKIFHNGDSLGFVLETIPLVGSSEEMQKEITNLFTILLPEESALQVMLWADPYIGDLLDQFSISRQESAPILKDLMQRRINYLKQFAFASPLKPYTLRHFRVFLAFSIKKPDSYRQASHELAKLKQQIITTLEMLNLPVKDWRPKDLLSTLEGMLSMNPGSVDPANIRWNRFEKLSDQLSNATSNLVVGEKGISLRDQKVVIKTYSARQFPSYWSLHAMGELIGDSERDQAQIPCPFMIHYGICIPKQDGPKNKVLAKATYVEKQATSPIGKYLTDITREAEELHFVREQIGRGERIVQTHFGVTLYSTPEGMDQAEQTLLNLFTSREWVLEANRFFH